MDEKVDFDYSTIYDDVDTLQDEILNPKGESEFKKLEVANVWKLDNR